MLLKLPYKVLYTLLCMLSCITGTIQLTAANIFLEGHMLVSPAVKHSTAHKKSPTHKCVNKINFCMLIKLLKNQLFCFKNKLQYSVSHQPDRVEEAWIITNMDNPNSKFSTHTCLHSASQNWHNAVITEKRFSLCFLPYLPLIAIRNRNVADNKIR